MGKKIIIAHVIGLVKLKEDYRQSCHAFLKDRCKTLHTIDVKKGDKDGLLLLLT